jgi:nucleoside-diphosphate-sugar epimerase
MNSSDQNEIWGDGSARHEFMCCGDLADIMIHAVSDLSQVPDLMNAGDGHDY